MKNLILIMAVMLFAGCATSEQLAKNLNSKSLSGDGTYVKTVIGIDTETKVPSIETRVISGNFIDVKSGENFFDFSVKQSSSVFNAEAKTVLIRATIQTKDKQDLHNSIKHITGAFKEIYAK